MKEIECDEYEDIATLTGTNRLTSPKQPSRCQSCGDTGYDTQGAYCLCKKGQELMLEDE